MHLIILVLSLRDGKFCISIKFYANRWRRKQTNSGFLFSYRLAIRLEFLGFIVVLTAALVAVLSRGSISPGIAGLSVTYSLTVTTVLSFLVRTYSDYETNVVSVERLLEYTRTPVEPEDEEEPSDPNWPARGQIVFEDFSARYRPELDLVLRKFNLRINSAERVGLVGRTGAGKCLKIPLLISIYLFNRTLIIISLYQENHRSLWRFSGSLRLQMVASLSTM